MSNSEIQTISISDGSALELCRLNEVDDATWAELTDFVAKCPETAQTLQGMARNPEAMQGWLQLRAAAEHYQMKVHRSSTMTQLLETLEADPALGHIFQDLRKNGVKAALTYCNEEMMMDISEKVRTYFQEWEMLLQKLETLPYPLHEAAKEKDHHVMLELLERRKRSAEGFDLDAQDPEGISALGYAVWAGHLATTKVLIEYGADPYAVDSCGNTCVHYAAGYGHPELLDSASACIGVTRQALLQWKWRYKVSRSRRFTSWRPLEFDPKKTSNQVPASFCLELKTKHLCGIPF